MDAFFGVLPLLDEPWSVPVPVSVSFGSTAALSFPSFGEDDIVANDKEPLLSLEVEFLFVVAVELLVDGAGPSLLTISCFASTLLVPGLVLLIFILRPLSAAPEWSIVTLITEFEVEESVAAEGGLGFPPVLDPDAPAADDDDFPLGVLLFGALVEDCTGECGICICGDGFVEDVG